MRVNWNLIYQRKIVFKNFLKPIEKMYCQLFDSKIYIKIKKKHKSIITEEWTKKILPSHGGWLTQLKLSKDARWFQKMLVTILCKSSIKVCAIANVKISQLKILTANFCLCYNWLPMNYWRKHGVIIVEFTIATRLDILIVNAIFNIIIIITVTLHSFWLLSKLQFLISTCSFIQWNFKEVLIEWSPISWKLLLNGMYMPIGIYYLFILFLMLLARFQS